MKQTLIKATLLAASVGLVVSCSPSNTQNENTTIGAVTGAVIGGVAGSAIGAGTGQVAAIGVGVVAGAFIGGEIGHSMDHSDNEQAQYALEHAPQHKPHHWHNKHTDRHYTVIPTSKAEAMYGHSHCRKFIVTSYVKGKKEQANGVACRKVDGAWETIK